MEPCELRATFNDGAVVSTPLRGKEGEGCRIRAPEAASRYVLDLDVVLKGLCLLPIGSTEGDGDGEILFTAS